MEASVRKAMIDSEITVEASVRPRHGVAMNKNATAG